MPKSAHPGLLRALRHRNYRLFFAGQSISLAGTWITRIATSWLVYRLTGSELLLGLVAFCSQIPMLVIGPLAGVFVDRWNRHRVLLVTQALSLLQSLALAVLTLAGIITVPEILGLQLAQGVINAFDTPARQAFLVSMIDDRADLPNAIALNSSMVNGSRIVGPSIGGILIALVGEGWCFLIDSVSYVAVIGTLIAMRLPAASRLKPTTRILEELGAGFRYVTRFAPVRTLLLLVALLSMMGIPYTTLMPAIATDVLGGDADTLGFLMGASGAGALAGALLLASRRSVVGLGRLIAISAATFGVGLVGFGLSRSFWLSLAVMPVVGGGFMVALASTNTIVQTLVAEQLRGRVMAFYAVAFLGTAPIGSLFAGAIAERYGAPVAIVFGGVACIAGAGWFMTRLPGIRKLVRPIYIEQGIIDRVPAARDEAVPRVPRVSAETDGPAPSDRAGPPRHQ